MQSNKPKRVRGWLFDVYPSNIGEVTVWVISENGERVKLRDEFQPKIYVSGKQVEIDRLASGFYSNDLRLRLKIAEESQLLRAKF